MTRIRVPGKWVLAGEHAVLRGHSAVALPHPELHLELSYEPGPQGFNIDPASAAPILRELAATAQTPLPTTGRLTLASTVPAGAGLGSSAALCVAVTRWLRPELQGQELATHATRLENLFHGQSSGMDVAAIVAQAPIVFQRGEPARKLPLQKLPRFSFHDTGQRASTRDCVARVSQIAATETGRALDQAMGQAADAAAAGLALYSAGDTQAGLARLQEAMDTAQRCFEEWGLYPPQAAARERELRTQGARAVKLTGAGAGGYLVALWD